MAGIEGLAWFQAVSLLMPSVHQAALVIGIGVAITIYAFDVSLITVDLSPPLRRDEGSGSKRGKFSASVLARLGIVLFSALITSQAIGIVFQADTIEARRQAHNDQAIRRVVAEKASEYEAKINAAEAKLGQSKHDLRMELAGMNPSAKKVKAGPGSISRSIEAEIAKIEQTLRELPTEKAKQIAAIKSMDAEALRKEFSLDYWPKTFGTIYSIYQAIQAEKRFLSLEDAFGMALVGILFLSMLVLKLLQPRSVMIYYAEQLQDGWSAYRDHGAFAGLFTSVPSPWQFYDAMRDYYADQQAKTEAEASARLDQTLQNKLARGKAAIAAIKHERGVEASLLLQQRQGLADSQQDYAKALARLEKLDTDLAATDAAVQKGEVEVVQIQARSKQLKLQIEALHFEKQQRERLGIDGLAAELRRLGLALADCQRAIQDTQAEQRQNADAIAEKGEVKRQLQASINGNGLDGNGVANVAASLNRAASECERLKSEALRLAQKRHELDAQRVALESSLGATQADYGRKFATLSNVLQEYDQQRGAELRRRIANPHDEQAVHNVLAALSEDLHEVDGQLKTAEARLNSLQQTQATQQQCRKPAESEVEQMGQDIARQQAAVAGQEAAIHAMNQDIDDLEQSLRTFRREQAKQLW
jgi:chromosome segregation ATPase